MSLEHQCICGACEDCLGAIRRHEDAVIRSVSESPRDPQKQVTTADIEAVARRYDEEHRGGIGRGDIDTELAERLAVWVNEKLARSADHPEQSASEQIGEMLDRLDDTRASLTLGSMEKPPLSESDYLERIRAHRAARECIESLFTRLQQEREDDRMEMAVSAVKRMREAGYNEALLGRFLDEAREVSRLRSLSTPSPAAPPSREPRFAFENDEMPCSPCGKITPHRLFGDVWRCSECGGVSSTVESPAPSREPAETETLKGIRKDWRYWREWHSSGLCVSCGAKKERLPHHCDECYAALYPTKP